MPACQRVLLTVVLLFALLAGRVNAQTLPPAVNAPATDPGLWQQDTLSGDWGGLRTQILDAGIKIGLQEQSELWGNMAGGLRTGVVYDGLTTASVSVDLDKLAGWAGATFFVSAFQIHGSGPTANLVGNQQVVSNIEATRGTKLYMLWLEQKLWSGRLTIRIGQEGANDQMMISQYSAMLLNSSFGFPGLPAVDLPSGGPNYPIGAPFVRGQFQASDHVTLVGALFSDDPAPPGSGDPQLRDGGGDAFRLNDHALGFAELWYSPDPAGQAIALPTTYKIGAWYDSGHFADQLIDTSGQSLASPSSTGVPRPHSTGFAVYGIIDQKIWQAPGAEGSGIGVFLLVMGAPAEYNRSNVFVEAGLNWKAPFPGRDHDIFGFGISYLGISPAARRYSAELVAATGSGAVYASNETVFEATYLYQAAPWLSLQPDLQFVANPGAGMPTADTTHALPDALVAGVHATVTF